MTDRLTIALAQMNQRIGDLAANAAAMLAMREKAAGADLLLCPELQLIGYPPEDLVLKPALVRAAAEEAARLVAATASPGPAMLIGTVVEERGQALQRDAARRRRPRSGAGAEARAAQLRHVRREARLRPRPAARAGRVSRGEARHPDLRGYLAGHGLRPSRRARGGDAAGPQRQPLRDSTRTRCGRRWSRAASPRPACRSPISTASAGRTNWRSTARPSSCNRTTASSVAQMPDWDEALQMTEWVRTPDGWRCTTRRTHELDCYPEDIYRAMMVALARLCEPQRLSRRHPRPVGRDRQRIVGSGRGRCAGRRTGCAA